MSIPDIIYVASVFPHYVQDGRGPSRGNILFAETYIGGPEIENQTSIDSYSAARIFLGTMPLGFGGNPCDRKLYRWIARKPYFGGRVSTSYRIFLLYLVPRAESLSSLYGLVSDHNTPA